MLKYRNLFVLLLVLLFAFRMATLPAEEQPSVTIVLKAVPGLQYDQVRFKVKPGTKVELVLTNADDMSHNLLITRPGKREEIVAAALQLGEDGPKVDYIPDVPEVLWAIPVVDPQETKSITFTAPQEPGVYPYVCTYPGHGAVMYGAMYVTEEEMPAIEHDIHIPPGRKSEGAADGHMTHQPKSPHPYQPEPPYLYRVFIDGASPAAIAVSLPEDISYCWDAGTCRLRFAWHGGFVDNSVLWKGKGDVSSIVIGTVFFRDKTAYPMRIGNPDHVPAVDFKGYRLIDRYPEFHYTVDGMDVYEMLKPEKASVGLQRTFSIPGAAQTLWLTVHPEDGVTYQASAGKWVEGALKLSPAEARQFTITMTKKEGVAL